MFFLYTVYTINIENQIFRRNKNELKTINMSNAFNTVILISVSYFVIHIHISNFKDKFFFLLFLV